MAGKELHALQIATTGGPDGHSPAMSGHTELLKVSGQQVVEVLVATHHTEHGMSGTGI